MAYHVTKVVCGVLLAAVAVLACVGGARADQLDDLVRLALNESIALDRLADMTDIYGPRLTGTQALEDSIDWIVTKLREDNVSNVYTEPVQVPVWVRGAESAAMISPRVHDLPMLGLGMSIGTGPNGITADVIVVHSFDELEERSAEVPGKIVVYNPPWVSYGVNGVFRREGSLRAEAHGAVATLVRSIAPYSLSTPHTGSMETAGIPGAAITHEDADLIDRLVARGLTVTIKLYMEAQFLPDQFSRNIIAEVTGTTLPNEVVVMGGHIDSWDVGAGVMDDAGGAFVAWEALRLMAKYNIRPRRTVRVVFWTNEENGARGADQYRDNRDNEIATTSFALESDSGIFAPVSIGFSGTEAAYQTMVGIGARYLTAVGSGNVTRGGGGVDIQPLCDAGIPCAGLTVSSGARADKTDWYFYYHHTNADSITHLLREEVNKCVASMAVWAYAVADLPNLLPRA